jgi:hypothetical protein
MAGWRTVWNKGTDCEDATSRQLKQMKDDKCAGGQLDECNDTRSRTGMRLKVSASLETIEADTIIMKGIENRSIFLTKPMAGQVDDLY